MVSFDVLKDGKINAMIMNFDDGAFDDKVTGIFNRYGIKGTFNLIAKPGQEFDIPALRKIYEGHEIACHGAEHVALTNLNDPVILNELYEHKKAVEAISGKPVIGMAYAEGSYSDSAIAVARSCGLYYSRTTRDTNNYKIPEDFMEWHPTAHINPRLPALEIGQKFLAALDGYYCRARLFHCWSHGHEYQSDWNALEEFCKLMGNNDRIWYTTCGEFYLYVMAQKRLIISADNKMVYNPSAIRVWFRNTETKEILSVGPGETLYM